MANKQGWVCLAASTSFHHGEKESVAAEIRRIFGGDLVEMRTVSDEDLERSGEYFVFVKCNNYHDHVDSLIESPAVAHVVPSYRDPSFLSEVEVRSFSSSVDRKINPEDFVYGDIVKIKETEEEFDHLRNLTGIVVMLVGDKLDGKKVGVGYCGVFFRFHTTSFSVPISVTSLELLDNVLSQRRFLPFRRNVHRSNLFKSDMIEKAKKAVSTIVSNDKMCRKRRRELETTFRR